MESLLSKSIRKVINRTIIVYENGDKPVFKDIAIRFLIRFIPFETFSFLGTLGNGWHDKWSNTFVIKEALFKDSNRQHKL